jgi:hypothetical protein
VSSVSSVSGSGGSSLYSSSAAGGAACWWLVVLVVLVVLGVCGKGRRKKNDESDVHLPQPNYLLYSVAYLLLAPPPFSVLLFFNRIFGRASGPAFWAFRRAFRGHPGPAHQTSGRKARQQRQPE